MYKQAFGVLNLKPAEFWDLTWDEFWQLYQGWQVRRQYDLEHTRLIMTAVANAAFGQKKAVKPTQIMQLPEIDQSDSRKKFNQAKYDDWLRKFSEMEIAAGRLKPGTLIQLAKRTTE